MDFLELNKILLEKLLQNMQKVLNFKSVFWMGLIASHISSFRKLHEHNTEPILTN